MHPSSMENMRYFVDKYLDKSKNCRILDIGSQVVEGEGGGSYKTLFFNELGKWSYVGADMVSGDNVDVVLEKVYNWKELKSNSFDCIICGQALEHIEFFWLTILEIRRVLKHGGICCIIAPSSGAEHKYPVDCYRFYPDGMKAIARFACLTVKEAYAQWDPEKYPSMDQEWKDCVLIAQKPEKNLFLDIKSCLKGKLIKLATSGASR